MISSSTPTHPYAAAVSRHAVAAAEAATGGPLLRLDARPGKPKRAITGSRSTAWPRRRGRPRRWAAGPSSPWASRSLPPSPTCRTSGSWCGWSQHRKSPRPLLSHSIDPGRGPFATKADENCCGSIGSISSSPNSGGTATHRKIVAARELGLPVMLLRRHPFRLPRQPARSRRRSGGSGRCWGNVGDKPQRVEPAPAGQGP